MLNSFLISIAIYFVAPGQDTQANAKWLTDYDRAVEIATAENKPILISFAGSDWCKPCIKLTKEVFEQPAFVDYANEQLVLLLLDFPRLKKNALSGTQVTHNEKLAESYNQEGIFPLVILINSKGEVIDKTGYRPGGAVSFIEYLESVL